MLINQPNLLCIWMKNDLYGWAMSQYLLYGRLKWLNQKEIDKFVVNSIGKNSPTGYILEVDLEYPDELHEMHNDYPLPPEKNLKLVMICCQTIVAVLQINMT